jgi:alkylation response protein AidB-like acyl-CoA dehydrogenase
MPALNPCDLYDVRSLLSEEECAVQDTVARFTDERVLPIIGDAFEQGRFPRELIPEIASLGLLGSSLPEDYGCAGMNGVSYGLICQELERGDSAASAASSRCRARCACIRSTPMAARNNAVRGCRAWRAARSSAASA